MNGSIDRRRVLKGAGACLALPWLEALSPPAKAVGAPAATAAAGAASAARSVFIFVPNGVNMWRWHPQEFGADCDLGPTLAPLAPFRKELTVFSGLEHFRVKGGHFEVGIFLTGNVEYGSKDIPTDSTISIDQHIAEAVGRETRFHSLALSPVGGNVSISYDRKGRIVNAENNLRRLYGELFGSPDVVARLERRGSVLDLLRDQSSSLSRQLGRADRHRFNDYVESVRDVESRLQSDRSYFSSRPQAEHDAGLVLDADPMAQRGDYLRTLYDIMALALQTNQTRVATLCTAYTGGNAWGRWPEFGSYEWHGTGHNTGDLPEDQKPKEYAFLASVDRWLVERLGGFLDRLSKIDEGENSLLANTMVLYGGGMSWGASHGGRNLPILLAGGSALGIKHKVHLCLNEHLYPTMLDPKAGGGGPDANKTSVSDLLRTISERMGVPAEGFAQSRRRVDEILA